MDDSGRGPRLHVAFVAPEAWSAAAGFSGERTGGAETQQLLLASGLRERGYPVTLLVAPPEGSTAPLPDWVSPAFTRRDTRSRSGYLTDSFRLFSAMARTGADVFVQRCSFHDAPRVALFSRLLDARFIFWVGAEYNVNREWMATGLSPLRRTAYMEALRSADVLVCQTSHQARALLDGFGLSSTVIPNAVEIPETAMERVTPSGLQLTALWGGRVNANKRPEALVEIAGLLPEWRFRTAVIRERGREDEHVAFLKAAHEVRELEIMEDLPQERFLELVSSADLMLNTSVMEGFPNTLLEAFARGVPALTLGVDPDHAISSQGTGWVCGSVEEAVSEMRRLAREPERLLEAGRRARRYAASVHSPAAVLDSLQALLGRVGDPA